MPSQLRTLFVWQLVLGFFLCWLAIISDQWSLTEINVSSVSLSLRSGSSEARTAETKEMPKSTQGVATASPPSFTAVIKTGHQVWPLKPATLEPRQMPSSTASVELDTLSTGQQNSSAMLCIGALLHAVMCYSVIECSGPLQRAKVHFWNSCLPSNCLIQRMLYLIYAPHAELCSYQLQL